MGAKNSWVEIYNGSRLILKDSMSPSAVTGIAKNVHYKFCFRDSLKVIVKDKYGVEIRKAKIKRSKRIYIDKDGANFRLFGSNSIYGGI